MGCGSEFTAVALQTVATNANVLLTEEPVSGSCFVSHRDGSGLVTLNGVPNQCCTRYRVMFNANIAIPAGGTVEPISLAIALNGEAVQSTTMIITPAAVEQFGNVSASIYVTSQRGCCQQLSIKNTSTQDISVQNANLIVELAN